MNVKITRDWIKSFFVMIVAVIIMGMCVSLLVMCDMGTDPCSAMNYGISHKIGMSFGNYQLLSNIVYISGSYLHAKWTWNSTVLCSIFFD